MEKANKKTERALKVANSCPPPSGGFGTIVVEKFSLSCGNHIFILARVEWVGKTFFNDFVYNFTN